MRTPLMVVAVCLCAWTEATYADDVARGFLLFSRSWQPDEGLGPRFNARSCVACHWLGGTGGAGTNAQNVQLRFRPENFEQIKLIHSQGTDPDYPEIRYRALGLLTGPTPSQPHAPKWKALAAADRRLWKQPVKVMKVSGSRQEISQRSTPALFGAGAIDAISVDTLRAVATRQSDLSPGITGRLAGRFGWRGQTLTLREFVVGACENELGLTTVDASPERHLKQLGKGWALDDDLVSFVRALPRPRRVLPASQVERNLVQNGEGLFHSVGCTACHMPSIGGVTEIYSDLLIHDMGEKLADSAAAQAGFSGTTPMTASFGPYGGSLSNEPESVERRSIARREWRTPPLWGVAVSAPYMHDGRAPDLRTAILMHGGEAAPSVARFRQLGVPGQKRLLAFLMTLQGPDPAELHRVLKAPGD